MSGFPDLIDFGGWGMYAGSDNPVDDKMGMKKYYLYFIKRSTLWRLRQIYNQINNR